MTDEHWGDRMSQYFDGELTDIERAVADAHLLLCDTCRQHRDDFEDIRTSVRGAPAPARSDPWPAIAREISARRWSGARPMRWAAAILLPLAIGAAFWWTSEGRRRAMAPTTAAVLPDDSGDQAMRAELAVLEGRFRLVEAQLDPDTAAAIRDGLATLEAALTRAEAELARDRDSPLLEALVARAQRQKLRLLRSVTKS